MATNDLDQDLVGIRRSVASFGVLQALTLSFLDFSEKLLMSWQDSFNKFSTDVDACISRVQSHLTDLQNQVSTLQQQLANADIPADAQATLDALDAKVNAFDVQPPTPPTPPDQPAQPTS